MRSGRLVPDGGYTFREKWRYRFRVWKEIGRYMKAVGANHNSTRILLMPSLEGDEIDCVKTFCRVPEEGIVALDMNPAVVATLKRRYPKIETIGLRLSEAGERAAGAGVRIANLDLCTNVSGLWEVSDFLRGFGIAQPYIVGINILRGREAQWQTAELTEARQLVPGPMDAHEKIGALAGHLESTDIGRLRFLASHLGGHVLDACCGWTDLPTTAPSLLKANTYVSSNGQSFLWSVWRLAHYAYRGNGTEHVVYHMTRAEIRERRVSRDWHGSIKKDLKRSVARPFCQTARMPLSGVTWIRMVAGRHK